MADEFKPTPLIELVSVLPFATAAELVQITIVPSTPHLRGFRLDWSPLGTTFDAETARTMAAIPVQFGPIREVGVNGVQARHLLAMARHLLQALNVPPHGNRETSLAITAIDQALQWLHMRQAERLERNVEGTTQP